MLVQRNLMLVMNEILLIIQKRMSQGLVRWEPWCSSKWKETIHKIM